MEYKVIEADPDSKHGLVSVSIQMSYHDWYAVENSLHWSSLLEYIERLQTLNNR